MVSITSIGPTNGEPLAPLLRRLNSYVHFDGGLSCGIIHSHSPSRDPRKQRIHFLRTKLMVQIHQALLAERLGGLDVIVCTGGLWRASQETIKPTFVRDQLIEILLSTFFRNGDDFPRKYEADFLEEIVRRQTAELAEKPLILKEMLSRNTMENIYYALASCRLKLGTLPTNIFAVKSEGMLERLERDYRTVLKKLGHRPNTVVLFCPRDRLLHEENVEQVEKRKNSRLLRTLSYMLFLMFKNERITIRRLRTMQEG